MIEWLWAVGGLVVGLAGGFAIARRRAPAAPVSEATPVPLDLSAPLPVATVPAATEAATECAESEATLPPPPHLVRLLGEALRSPLRTLRRADGVPALAVEQLERIVWQTRMLLSRPRPMQAKPTSPISLLQEAAEDVAPLREGKVGASWSLLNRQPVHVDPERMRAALRELLYAGAEAAGPGGRVGIKVLGNDDPAYPVKIEIEIGRRGSEADPLSVLVSRHLIEAQGGRLELDANVTRVVLRKAAPEEIDDVA